MLGETRRRLATHEAAQGLMRATAQQFREHLTGAERSEDHEHRACARSDEARQTTGHRGQINYAIQWSEI